MSDQVTLIEDAPLQPDVERVAHALAERFSGPWALCTVVQRDSHRRVAQVAVDAYRAVEAS